MLLKIDDFAAFIANWDDKITNLRSIAKQLNIGLDSLVFFDDNPAERALVEKFTSRRSKSSTYPMIRHFSCALSKVRSVSNGRN